MSPICLSTLSSTMSILSFTLLIASLSLCPPTRSPLLSPSVSKNKICHKLDPIGSLASHQCHQLPSPFLSPLLYLSTLSSILSFTLLVASRPVLHYSPPSVSKNKICHKSDPIPCFPSMPSTPITMLVTAAVPVYAVIHSILHAARR